MHELRGQQRLNFSQAVRDSMIDGLRLPARQAHLLKTIDRLMRDEESGEPNVHTLKDEIGNVTIELTLIALAVAMGCSSDTSRRAYKQLDATAYLTVEPVDGRPHLFTVHWPAIVNDTQRPQVTGAVARRAQPVAAKAARGSTDFARGSNAATPPGGSQHVSPVMTDEILRSETQVMTHAARCQGSQSARGGSRTGWEIATEQLRDLSIVEAVLVPRAIATFRIPDSQANRDGILAAACCAVAKGREPPKLFTNLVKRRAWEMSGLHGIAEQHFDEVRAWRRQREQLPRQLETTDGYYAGLSADQAFEQRRSDAIAQLRTSGLGGGS